MAVSGWWLTQIFANNCQGPWPLDANGEHNTTERNHSEQGSRGAGEQGGRGAGRTEYHEM